MGIDQPIQLHQWLQQFSQVQMILFLGRSNVGKSSLINSLFGSKTARTSKTPGRTRQVNIFSFQLRSLKEEKESPVFYFCDVPGYGYASVNKEMQKNWNHLMGEIFENLPPQTLLINIQDARHPRQKVDESLEEFILPQPTPKVLCLNKIDQLDTQKAKHQFSKILIENKKHYWGFFHQIFQISCLNGQGLGELGEYINQFLSAQNYGQKN